ncbi:winged helix DNA-binding domain-containing protein, partial [Ramicandelaber brevisporus]
MGASGSAGGANAKPVANQFATKLYQLVSDDANRDVIMWSPSGGSFLVLNQEELEKKILAVHFKHSKFASFQRQLNMYGFSKVNKSPRGNKAANDMMLAEFAHRYFIQGREDLLAEIKRR